MVTFGGAAAGVNPTVDWLPSLVFSVNVWAPCSWTVIWPVKRLESSIWANAKGASVTGPPVPV